MRRCSTYNFFLICVRKVRDIKHRDIKQQIRNKCLEIYISNKLTVLDVISYNITNLQKKTL